MKSNIRRETQMSEYLEKKKENDIFVKFCRGMLAEYILLPHANIITRPKPC